MLILYRSLGNADDVREDTRAFEIIKAINNIKALGEIATTRRISNMTDIKESNVSFVLGDLIMNGKVRKLPKQGREQPYDIV